jgi:isocitrate dehydrogenase
MKKITVAKGDGIGPEIMAGVIKIFESANVPLEYQYIEVGEKVYQEGHLSGIDPKSWDIIKKNKVILKAPITTPQGKGFQSLNVSMRKKLGLFANVRPVKSFAPYVKTFYPDTKLTIVRENEEDLYAGIEYRQTQGVSQCLKLISEDGCERIIRYAFEYAVQTNAKKVTCMGKDNIMKITDGMFRRVFDRVKLEYPNIITDYYIVDIGAAHLATPRSDRFEVIVTENLYGDILSDIIAQVMGSVGMCGSSNVGEKYSMFEAIHGSAPDIAGKGIANPSGLLSGGLMMLRHLGLHSHALLIENAWLYTIESGIHTGDIRSDKLTKKLVDTNEFCEEIIKNIGKFPQFLKAEESSSKEIKVVLTAKMTTLKKELTGVDIYVDSHGESIDQMLLKVKEVNLKSNQLKLVRVSNRGLEVWPETTESHQVDLYQFRFECGDKMGVSPAFPRLVSKSEVQELYIQYCSKLDVVKTENLYSFEGAFGYSR